MHNRRVILSWVLLLLILVCSSDADEFSIYGSDTRWQKYTKTRRKPYKEITLSGQDLFGLDFAVSVDRQKGLYSSLHCDTRIHLIDLNTGDHLLTLEGHPKSTQCLAFSSDGKRAVSGGGVFRGWTSRFWGLLSGKQSEGDATLRFWDLASGKQIGHAKGHEDYIRSVAYLPVDNKALSGGGQGDILLWDLEKMQVLKRFVGHSSGIRHNCLVWSQDGKTFLSGSWDGSIRLWDIQTGKEVAHLQAGYGRVMSLALSPDGKYALSSYLGPVIFWDLENQREINRFSVPGNPWFADQQLHVASVAFSPDGKTALFGLVFGTVIWWDLNEWRQIGINRLHEDELAFVAYSADGKSCISIGCDTDAAREEAKVKFWQLPPPNNVSISTTKPPPKTIKLPVDEKMSIDLIYIKPDSFLMGRDTSLARDRRLYRLGVILDRLNRNRIGLGYDEGPPRTVKITKGFYIGKYKVTGTQFCKFLNTMDNPQDYVKLNRSARIEMTDGVYVPKAGCENGPINVVHWKGAVAFCDWLSQQTGFTVRLPTEAEWEFVAYGPERRSYPWGDEREENVEYYEDSVRDYKTYPHLWSCASVDAFPENATPDGVVGMIGYMGEWCSDFYAIRYLKDDVIDPQGPREEDLPVDSRSRVIPTVEGRYHVLRRCAPSTTTRSYGDTVGDSGIYGFRIVVEKP